MKTFTLYLEPEAPPVQDISITVLHAQTGTPIPGAMVTVGTFGTRTTNASGTAVFSGLPVGARVKVSVRADGYKPTETEIVI
ncbi:MAG: carboxypeptidase-like regulatory domain-containing protein [Nanopusillaceae archaeon]